MAFKITIQKVDEGHNAEIAKTNNLHAVVVIKESNITSDTLDKFLTMAEKGYMTAYSIDSMNLVQFIDMYWAETPQ